MQSMQPKSSSCVVVFPCSLGPAPDSSLSSSYHSCDGSSFVFIGFHRIKAAQKPIHSLSKGCFMRSSCSVQSLIRCHGFYFFLFLLIISTLPIDSSCGHGHEANPFVKPFGMQPKLLCSSSIDRSIIECRKFL